MLKKIEFEPGIVKESTQYASNGWYDSGNVRFRGGFPETIGGWARDSDYSLDGIVRKMFTWTDYGSAKLFAIGTDWKTYIVAGGNKFDVTAIRASVSNHPGDNFGTYHNPTGSAGESITGEFIRVLDNAHGASLNDFVSFSGMADSAVWKSPTSTGVNIRTELNDKEKQVAYVFDDDEYWIAIDTTVVTGMTAGAGGVSADINYMVSVGLSVQTEGTGWGATVWGGDSGEGWGDPANVSILTGELRHVYLDNYNEDLMMSNSGGPIYYWDTGTNSTLGVPNVGDQFRLKELGAFTGSSNPPNVCDSFLVSDRDGHVIALGCNDIGLSGHNSLMVRWSDQNNPFDWTPSPSNTSGGQMLRLGSEIIGAVNTKSEILLFTDGGVYSMRYTGPPDTFSFSIVSEGVELMTSESVLDVANIVYFMGSDKFYMYTGAVSTLECPVQKEVFGNFNVSAREKVFAGLNADFSEIIWFYPSSDSWEPDMYVAFNYSEKTWYTGSFDMSPISSQSASTNSYNRTAWLDSRTMNESLSGYIEEYNPNSTPEVKKSGVMIHETGRTAQGQNLDCFLESGLFGIGEGDQLSYVSRILPDFQFFGFSENPADQMITVKLKGNNFPGEIPSELSSTSIDYSVSGGTLTPVGNSTGVRARAREISIRLESSGNSAGWRLGATRIDAKPDGRR